MDQNKDWKPIAALALAALALLVALGGQRGYGNNPASAVPQPIIVQPAAPSTGSTGGGTAPIITMPGAQPYAPQGWGGGAGWRGGWHMFPLLPLLFLAGLIFVAFRL